MTWAGSSYPTRRCGHSLRFLWIGSFDVWRCWAVAQHLFHPRSSRRIQQAVLADGFADELAGDFALFHDENAVGERQHRLRLARHHDDADPLVAKPPDDLHNIILGADIHPAR